VTGDWQFVIGVWWRMGRKGEKNADGRRKKKEGRKNSDSEGSEQLKTKN
jgi:hypothetical protein